MSPAHFAVNFFVALFALVDPVGSTPMFAAVTVGATGAGRRLTALYISLFALGFLAFFFFTGLSLLRFFGISMPAFRIAGGALLFLLGLDMARGNLATTLGEAAGETSELSTRAYACKRFQNLVTPFGMPFLIGPGAISTVVIYAGGAGKIGWRGQAAGLAVIFAVSLSILASLWLTGLITRLLGAIGMVIVIRVLGLILCAMAVQFILGGFSDSTVGMLRPAAISP